MLLIFAQWNVIYNMYQMQTYWCECVSVNECFDKLFPCIHVEEKNCNNLDIGSSNPSIMDYLTKAWHV